MAINRRRRYSHRTPYNKNTRMYQQRSRFKSFLNQYIAALKKRNPKTIIFTAGLLLIFVVLPIVLAITLTGSKDVKASTNNSLSDNIVAFADTEATTPTPSPSPSPSPSPTPVLLQYGDEHQVIIEIQEQLMELGYLDFCVTTEHFGTSTQAAVKLYQRQLGEEQTGVVDDGLYKSLMSSDAEKYTLSLEMEGPDVTAVQERLYQMGYIIEKKYLTGYFGDITKEAVIAFQKNNGLTADGKVGMKTTETLYSPDAKANILSFGEESDIVLKYQQKLASLAYLTTTPDGKYGKDTAAAVKLFQEKNALIVDGYLGPATRDLIDSGEAQPNALSIGDSGNTVKNVQKMLVQANCLTSKSTTGYYGSVTEAAVRLFQATNKLSIDGKAGKQTIGLLQAGGYKKASDPITSGSVGSTPSKNKVEQMLAIARSKMGCPYVRGAKGPDKFDCSGFVYWVLKQTGVKQSYLTTYGWRSMTKYTKITNIDALKPGDLILFHLNGMSSSKGHIGIVSKEDLMIHAVNDAVIESSYKQSYWNKRFICAYRIF